MNDFLIVYGICSLVALYFIVKGMTSSKGLEIYDEIIRKNPYADWGDFVLLSVIVIAYALLWPVLLYHLLFPRQRW